MAWTYGGQRIYPDKSGENTVAILPILQPLSGGSIIQNFGYQSTVRQYSGVIVGETIKEALEAFAKDGGTAHALVSPEGAMGNFMAKSFNADRTMSTCQTIDVTQPEAAPVYNFQIELYEA
jgi:hypothetical protein